jgi:hypothetical protein
MQKRRSKRRRAEVLASLGLPAHYRAIDLSKRPDDEIQVGPQCGAVREDWRPVFARMGQSMPDAAPGGKLR